MNYLRRYKLSRKLVCILTVVMFLSLLVMGGCSTASKPAPTKKTYIVGFSIDGVSSPYSAHSYEQMKSEWKQHPEVTLYETEAQSSALKQVADIEDLISKGVQLLIVTPRDTKTLVSVLSNAYKQGIKVVLINRIIDSEDYSASVVTDDIECGKVSGEYMGKALGGKGNVCIAAVTPGSSSYDKRTKGFLEGISEYPDIKIISTQPSASKRDQGKTLTENWIQAYGDKINGIHTNADEVALGIVQAIEQAGMTGKITVTSITGLMEACPFVKNGEIGQLATITNGVRIGVELSWKLLNGEQVDKQTVVPTTAITKDNVDKYYNAADYVVDDVL